MIFIFQMSLDIIVLFIVNFIPLQMMISMHMTLDFPLCICINISYFCKQICFSRTKHVKENIWNEDGL